MMAIKSCITSSPPLSARLIISNSTTPTYFTSSDDSATLKLGIASIALLDEMRYTLTSLQTSLKSRREALILTPLPAKNIIPFPSPCRRGLGRGGKGLGVRFFALYFTQRRTAISSTATANTSNGVHLWLEYRTKLAKVKSSNFKPYPGSSKCSATER